MDNPPTASNDRPPVPIGSHRRARRRRRARRLMWWAAWTLIPASILLAIFVHKGLLGIAGLVAAAVVAYAMLHPRHWPWRDEDDVAED